MVAARSSRYYLLAFSMERPALEKMVLMEMATKKLEFFFSGKDRKHDVVVRLLSHRWLQRRLKRRLPDTYSMRKQAPRDASFGMLGHDSLLSRSSVVIETTLFRKRKQIERDGRQCQERLRTLASTVYLDGKHAEILNGSK